MKSYILSFDQSTSTTKALLFDEMGDLVHRTDVGHRQLVNDLGWVEHDGEEILANLELAAKNLLEDSGIERSSVKAVAISNQRETAVAWDRRTGKPLYHAIVWQCGRAQAICEAIKGHAPLVHQRTGLHLSPYFSAGKFTWILENVEEARNLADQGNLVLSTMDSFLIYHLSQEKSVKTEFSNASRTQLLNIEKLTWDEDVAKLFGIPLSALPEVCSSDSLFGHTNLFGLLPHEVPIHGVLGDSQGALYAQGCLHSGMTKATYGTGSSIMMNIGTKPIFSKDLVTSLAWGLDSKPTYVLEGNINYTGATIKWLVDDVKLLSSSKDAGKLASAAQEIEGLFLVPAFSGLGAPYWDGEARALICGMDRRCGKNELVRAAEESIAFQIADVVFLMNEQSGTKISSLRVDGGPTNDSFLMQFQADILGCEVRIAPIEELSAQGPALIAAMKVGMMAGRKEPKPKALYQSEMDEAKRKRRYDLWQSAVKKALSS